MRKFVISIALLGATLVAAPTTAQDYRGDRGGYGYDQGYNQGGQRLQQIGQRIERLAQRREITQREAYTLRREYRYLVQLDYRLRRNGLNRTERQELNRRTTNLAQRVRMERNDGWNNGRDGQNGYDRNDRYDRDDGRQYRGDRDDRRGDDDDD